MQLKKSHISLEGLERRGGDGEARRNQNYGNTLRYRRLRRPKRPCMLHIINTSWKSPATERL